MPGPPIVVCGFAGRPTNLQEFARFHGADSYGADSCPPPTKLTISTVSSACTVVDA